MAKKQQQSPTDFESALKELEALVEHMERGDIGLEESLRYFERGIALTRICQQALRDAEQKIEILLHKDGEVSAQPYTPDT